MRPNRSLLEVLLLLLVVVIAPTAGVVWFMTAAMDNERAAVRETLTAAYRAQLSGLAQQLEAVWQTRQARLDAVGFEQPAAEIFATILRQGVADSAVLFDERGAPRYPDYAPAVAAGTMVEATDWQAAQRLEFGGRDQLAAAAAYERIARAAGGDVHIAARAFQAQARCLAKAGRHEAAAEILTGTLTEPRFRMARDSQARLIVPDALLLALHVLGDPNAAAWQSAADELAARLAHYGDPVMPAPQRRFLMQQLHELRPEVPPIDTLRAEELASRYLDSARSPQPGRRLELSGLPNIWQLAAADGAVVALFEEESVLQTLRSVAGEELARNDLDIELLPPGAEVGREPFLTDSPSALLPGWQLALFLSDQNAIDAVAKEQIAGYLWTGTLLIAGVVLVAILIARVVGRQIRTARLKNDLIATVTHELKTPLASTRLLVDTLLNGESHDQEKSREYLELIARENERLSRLIEDFLAFSRMERNKQAFDRVEVAPAGVVTAATETVKRRLDTDDDVFEIDVAPDLPPIAGDPDALSTVIVNLLENAYKYTTDDKQIVLRAYADNGHVVFSVRDNGIGLSRRAAKQVFDRFYQADRGLASSGNGVGLGLAIVKFIVDAHGGAVAVASQPGEGSTFTVRLPAVRLNQLPG